MRQRDEKKEVAVVRATIKLVNAHGFSDVSISKIAREAGVSPATIYIYYENKEDLLNQTYIALKNRMAVILTKGVDSDGDIETGTKQFLKNLVEFAMNEPNSVAFCEQFANSPFIQKIAQEEAEAAFQPLSRMMKRGMEIGVIKNAPSELIVAFTYLPILSLVKSKMAGNRSITDDVFEMAIERAWDAITP